MTPLRLLIVVQRYGVEVRGGAEQAARTLAERLAARGHHVEVLTTTARSYVDWSGDLAAGTSAVHGVTVHRLPVSPLRDRELFARLHDRVSVADRPVAPSLERAWLAAQGPSVPDLEPWLDQHASRFDVAVFFTYLYATTTEGLPVAARHTRTALVPCAHDEPTLALHVYDRVAHLADAVVFLTPEEGALVQHRFRLRVPQHVVGLGTELARGAGARDVGRFRARHGLREGPYVVYVGRIDPSKGTSWLVDAVAALNAARASSLRLVLLGERVIAPPERDDVLVIDDADDDERDAALAGAVALVHPSPHESFGMVVTEAWAAGTPVIAFGGNDVLRGHVERSGAGLLVRSAAELGAAVELLTADPVARDALGRAGRAHVEAHHDWPVVLDRWEAALRHAARGQRWSPGIAAPPRPLPPPELDSRTRTDGADPNRGAAAAAHGRVRVRDRLAVDTGLQDRGDAGLHRSERTRPARAAPPAAAQPEHDAQPGPRPIREDLPPAWLARPLVLALALFAALSSVGVVAAMAGAFHPAVVIPGALVVGGPLGWLTARALPRWSSTRTAHAGAAIALALIAAITVHNLLHHGQHVVADRDPGIYLTTARHLSDHGDLLVHGPSGPFVDAPGVSHNGAGFSPERGDTTLEPQFPHLTAALLATAGWVGQRGFFLLTPLVGGFALVCLYAWTTVLAGPRWAGVAAALTGVSMPFMVFARDAYSEPTALAALFGGAWLLHVADRSGRLAPWLLAGLVLGVSGMARVDGFLYLAPAVLAVALVARVGLRRRGVRPTAAMLAAALGGLAVTSAIGFFDTAWLTGSYYRESLGPRFGAMLGAAVAAGVAGWAVAPLLWRRPAERATGHAVAGSQPSDGGAVHRAANDAPTDDDRDGGAVHRAANDAPTGDDRGDDRGPTPWLRAAVVVACVGLVGFFAWGWWIRPDSEGLPAVAREGMDVLSYLPQAKTLSVHWLSWYVTPFGLAVGVAGLLWALVRLGWAPRPRPAVVAALGAILITMLVYLWTPSVTPDHPWAMRRFAAAAIPGLGAGAAILGHAVWRLGDRGALARRVLTGTAALAVAAGAVGATGSVTWPVQGARAQVPMRERINDVCNHLHDDDAVLVPIDGILALMFSVPVGVWCDVPSAGGTPALEPEHVAQLAVDWAEEGRRLVVVSSSATPLMNELLPTGMVAETIVTAPVYPMAVEPTIDRRPRRVVVDRRLGKGPDGEVTFHLYPIDVDAARRYLRSTRSETEPIASPDRGRWGGSARAGRRGAARRGGRARACAGSRRGAPR